MVLSINESLYELGALRYALAMILCEMFEIISICTIEMH